LPLVVCAAILVAAAPAAAQSDDDAALKLGEPDFTVIGLPTSLRMPAFKSAFRVTHRFTRPLDCETCSNSLAGDAFGIDQGALIGLEMRFGIVPNGQVGVLRTGDKTVELFAQYGIARQRGAMPVEASLLAALDSTNVGQRGEPSHFSPLLGIILTRLIADRAALYVEPMWINNTNQLPKELVDHNNTFIVGVGARVRIRPTVYLVAEAAPRAAGYKPGITQGSFGIEKRAGGHMFQLNFSNAFGTALSQIARGGLKEQLSNGSSKTNWYMGFNITRKFF